MKLAYYLFLSSLLGACSGITPTQKVGMEKMSSGNYAAAIVSLEAAKKEGADNEKLYLQLSDAKFKYAKDDFEKAKQLNNNDLAGAIVLFTRADDNATSSLEELKMIPKTEEKFKQTKEKEEFLSQLKSELSLKKKEHGILLDKVNEIKKTAKNKPENAYIECNSLAPFKEFIKEVAEAFTFIGDALLKDLEAKGWKAFNGNKLSEAKDQFDKILKYFPNNSRGSEGLLCLKSNENFKKQDFKSAYQNLSEIKKINAASSCLVKLEKNNFEKLVKNELTLAHKAEKENKISSQFLAMDHYLFLLSLPEIVGDQNENLKKEILERRVNLAKILLLNVKRWRALGVESLPLIYNTLRFAYRFDPTIAEKNAALMEEASQYIKSKAEFKTLLMLKAQEGGSFTELENQIRLKMLTASTTRPSLEFTTYLPDEEISKVKQVQDLARLPTAQKNKLSTYDYVLWINLLDYKIDEYGANQPFYKSSRYVSGTRMLDNQAWFAAQQEFNNAQASYNQSYQANQQMLAQCNNMNNAFAAGFCKGAIGGLSSARLDSARATLNATPRYVSENIISDYTYRQYTVGVNIYIRLEERFLDYRHDELLAPKIMEYKVTRKEGEILEGVQPSDVNGIKEGRFNVPDLAYEKKAGENKLVADLQSDLQTLVTKEKALRYCKIKGLKKEIAIMGSYQLCLLYEKNIEDHKDKPDYNDFKNAEINLAKFYQLTDADLAKYALGDSELPQTGNPLFK